MSRHTNTTESSTTPFKVRLQMAVEQWARILPRERIIDDATSVYGSCTSGTQRKIPVAVKVRTTAEVADVTRIASALQIPLYPISTGKNWGYGTANPVQDNCVILDLSAMNRIIEINADLCWVKLEPGVTQQQLFDYLQERDLDFMVPVTGAGPTCSILGNLLERGYGITPHTDHFGALLGLEAVLANGEIYRSALEEQAGDGLNQAFKWGIGPYLDGLFSQSNMGIVTSATIALQKRPERYEAFLFRVKSDSDLPAVVTAAREILQTLGSTVGGINLMNADRVLAMTVPYPKDLVPEGATMSKDMVKQLAAQYYIPAWTGAGALYGNRHVVKAAKRVIRQILAKHVSGLVFVSPGRASFLKRVADALTSFLPKSIGFGTRLQAMSLNLVNLLKILGGEPTEVALPLSYMKSGQLPAPDQKMDPAKDGAGLIWYSPLVPMNPETVIDYVAETKRLCLENGIEPLITLTSISERCFDSTVPILFNKASSKEVANARRCYDVLLEAGRAKGIFPYRFGIDQMRKLATEQSTFWNLVAKVKCAFDPYNIISPGRYEVVHRRDDDKN